MCIYLCECTRVCLCVLGSQVEDSSEVTVVSPAFTQSLGAGAEVGIAVSCSLYLLIVLLSDSDKFAVIHYLN